MVLTTPGWKEVPDERQVYVQSAQKWKYNTIYSKVYPQGALPYLKVLGNFLGIDPFFFTLSDPIRSLFMLNYILLSPPFLQKNLICFYHIQFQR